MFNDKLLSGRAAVSRAHGTASKAGTDYGADMLWKCAQPPCLAPVRTYHKLALCTSPPQELPLEERAISVGIPALACNARGSSSTRGRVRSQSHRQVAALPAGHTHSRRHSCSVSACKHVSLASSLLSFLSLPHVVCRVDQAAAAASCLLLCCFAASLLSAAVQAPRTFHGVAAPLALVLASVWEVVRAPAAALLALKSADVHAAVFVPGHTLPARTIGGICCVGWRSHVDAQKQIKPTQENPPSAACSCSALQHAVEACIPLLGLF